jgi:hypothetical protein
VNQETFERVDFDGADSVAPKLYKRVYLAGGKRRIKFYSVFTVWQGIRRKVALGSDLKAAVRRISTSTKRTTPRWSSPSKSISAKPAG